MWSWHVSLRTRCMNRGKLSHGDRRPETLGAGTAIDKICGQCAGVAKWFFDTRRSAGLDP